MPVIIDHISELCCLHGPMLVLKEEYDNNFIGYTLILVCTINRNRNTEKYVNKKSCYTHASCNPVRFELKRLKSQTHGIHQSYEDDPQYKLEKFVEEQLEERKQKFLQVKTSKRYFCMNCSKMLLLYNERKECEKEMHVIIGGVGENEDKEGKIALTKKIILQPMSLSLIDSANNTKKQAQYLFDCFTKRFIYKSLIFNKSDHDDNSILHKFFFVGCPSLYEYFKEKNNDDSIQPFCFDVDYRFRSFYPSDEFILYNFLTHHIFEIDDNKVNYENIKKTIANKNIKITYIIDPPFGIFTTSIASSFNQMKKDLCVTDGNIVIISPYFMESKIKEVFPNDRIIMLDYQINYQNHTQMSDANRDGNGSIVRLFTNDTISFVTKQINPNVKKFNKKYEFCKICRQWRRMNNVHCKICRTCPTKHGKTYKHCGRCGRCTKPSYEHCRKCNHCHLAKKECWIKE
ncbi:hypothetical protein SNEBB_006439 [Seison nebaliae]|nr:hypothetical protein SNEBB_006439 [Seison nebaliae]